MKEFVEESIGKGGNVQGEGPCSLKIETERDEKSARRLYRTVKEITRTLEAIRDELKEGFCCGNF